MDSVPIPLWSLGVLLIVIGPFVVQRMADVWVAVVERRTDEALSAMTARGEAHTVNVGDAPDEASVTQQDGADDPDDAGSSS